MQRYVAWGANGGDSDMGKNGLKIGTCSWNYKSWVGIVYSEQQNRAADYLPEYAKRFDTAEIDSTFYGIPKREWMQEYADKVPDGFRWTLKVPQQITLTHERGSRPLKANPTFMSNEVFDEFLEAIEPILSNTDSIMFEYEYLNRQKIGSLEEFLDPLDRFFTKAPGDFPYGIEPRNRDFLTDTYFDFLNSHGLHHVFSHKEYMTPVWNVYQRHKEKIEQADRTVIRLLGENRKAIEKKAGGRWDKILEPKDHELGKIVGMVASMVSKMYTILNVNTHYEGASPLTVAKIQNLYKQLL